MAQLTDEIRHRIESCGKTRYRISKETGIAASQLCRLMSGETGLSIESMEKLADYFGFEIVMRPKKRGTRKGRR